MLISRKRYKIETYFQWQTNRKLYVAYRMAPVLVTLKVISQGHSPFADLFKCNALNICAVFYQISTDNAHAWSLSDSWASCLHQWSCTIMKEGLFQENCLRLALWLQCAFCQITLTSYCHCVHCGTKCHQPFDSYTLQHNKTTVNCTTFPADLCLSGGSVTREIRKTLHK